MQLRVLPFRYAPEEEEECPSKAKTLAQEPLRALGGTIRRATAGFARSWETDTFHCTSDEVQEEPRNVQMPTTSVPQLPRYSSVHHARKHKDRAGHDSFVIHRSRSSGRSNSSRSKTQTSLGEQLAYVSVGNDHEAMPEPPPKTTEAVSFAQVPVERRPLVWAISTEQHDEDEGQSVVGGVESQVGRQSPEESHDNAETQFAHRDDGLLRLPLLIPEGGGKTPNEGLPSCVKVLHTQRHKLAGKQTWLDVCRDTP